MKTFNDASKQEEIGFLADLVKRFQRPENRQSYLASLLSSELLTWFCQTVAIDWYCNLAATLELQIEQGIQEHRQRADTARQAQEEAERLLRLSVKERNDLAAALAKSQEQAERMKEAWEGARHECDKWREHYSVMVAERNELSEQLDQAEARSKKMKIEFFDRMMAAVERGGK